MLLTSSRFSAAEAANFWCWRQGICQSTLVVFGEASLIDLAGAWIKMNHRKKRKATSKRKQTCFLSFQHSAKVLSDSNSMFWVGSTKGQDFLRLRNALGDN